MGFILEPRTVGDDFIINGWNWRPIVSFLVREAVIPHGERSERCLANGCGGYLTEPEAIRAAAKADDLIMKMKPESRMLYNGEITDRPIDSQKPVSEWNDSDTWNHYSARYAALKAFSEFCKRSGGFVVH